MAINAKIQSLYDAMESEGADVGTPEEFNSWFLKPGKEGYDNRKSVYNAFKDAGADVGENYEEFAGWLGLAPAGQTPAAATAASEPEAAPQGAAATAPVTPAQTPGAAPSAAQPQARKQLRGSILNAVKNVRSVISKKQGAPSPAPKAKQYFRLRRGGQDFYVPTEEVNEYGDLAGWNAKRGAGGELRVYMQTPEGKVVHVPLGVANQRRMQGYKYSTITSSKAWQPTIQRRNQTSEYLRNATDEFSRHSRAVADQVARAQKFMSVEGRQELSAAEMKARMAGTPTTVAGMGASSAQKAGAATSEGNGQSGPNTIQSPVVYDVVMGSDGKPTAQWLLPDGTLTTDLAEADMAEAQARKGRLQREFKKRMQSNGLDVQNQDDVRLQMMADGVQTGINMDPDVRKDMQRTMAENGLDPNNQEHILWVLNGDGRNILQYRLTKAEERLRGLMDRRARQLDAAQGGGDFASMLGSTASSANRNMHSTASVMGASQSRLDRDIEAATAEVAKIKNSMNEYDQQSSAAGSNWFVKAFKGVWDGIRDPNTWTAGALDFSMSHTARNADLTSTYGRNLIESYAMSEEMMSQAPNPGGWYSGGRFVGEMLGDPVTYASLGTGALGRKIAGKWVMKATARGMANEVAKRYTQSIGKRFLKRYVPAAAGSAANFTAFEGLRDMRQQWLDGGYTDDEGNFHEGFSWWHALKQGGHGALMGTAMGIFGAGMGNVGDYVAGLTDNVAGKVGVRAGQHGISLVGEGTIFAMPDIIEFHTMGDEQFDKLYAEKFGYASETDAARRKQARDAARNSLTWDAWTESQANIIGMKLGGLVTHPKSTIGNVKGVINLLRKKDARDHRSFGERVAAMLDRNPFGLELTTEERDELRSAGYGELADLFRKDGASTAKAKDGASTAKAKDGAVELYHESVEEGRAHYRTRWQPIGEGGTGGKLAYEELTGSTPKGNEFDGYSEMGRLMNDRRVSQSARAKAYYILTGHLLSPGTVMDYTTEEDADGIIVKSMAVNGDVVTSRRFKDKKSAQREIDKIVRQSELNSIDVGEHYHDGEVRKGLIKEACKAAGFAPDKASPVYERAMRGEEISAAERDMVEAINKKIREMGRSYMDTRDAEWLRKVVKDETGIDVDEALHKMPRARTENEQAAIDRYMEKLYPEEARRPKQADSEATTNPYDFDEPTPEQSEAQQAYFEGQELIEAYHDHSDPAKQAQARANADAIALQMQEAFQLVHEYFDTLDNPDDWKDRLAADPWEVLNDPELPAQKRDDVLYYINSKAALDGIMDAANEAADSRIAEVQRSVDLRTHKETGMVHPATLKVDDKQVYIVRGNVQMFPDGSAVDSRNSSESIVVCDPATGEYSFKSPDAIMRVDEPLDPQQELQTALDAIEADRNSIFGENMTPPTEAESQGPQDNDTEGAPVAMTDTPARETSEGYTPRDVEAYDRGYEEGLEVSKTLPDQILNGAIDDLRGREFLSDEWRGRLEAYEYEQQRRMQPVPETTESVLNPTENSVTEGETAPEAVSNVENGQQSALSRIPVGEDGEPQFHAAPDKETAWDALMEVTEGDSNAATEIALSQIKQATSELDALKKKGAPSKKAPKLTGGVMAMRAAQKAADANYQKAVDNYKAQVAEAEARLSAWNDIMAVYNSREAACKAAMRAKMDEANAAAHDAAVAKFEEEQRIKAEKQAEQERIGTHAVSPKIKEKWDKARKVWGNEDVIVLADGSELKGRYVLTEAGAATPSHDPFNGFEPTEGFPIDEHGQSVNDRDYKKDSDAQGLVQSMADSYDGRGWQDVPVADREFGITYSGNNKTMSGMIAARQNTDGKYIQSYHDYGYKRHGFSQADVEGFRHPRLLFIPDESLPFTAETFARFNAQEKKSQGKPEAAVKLGKIVPDNVFDNIVGDISRYDRLSDYYADERAVAHALGALMQAGVINDKQMPEMRTGTALSAAGKELIENTLIGKVFQASPDAVRQIISVPTLRQSIVMGLSEIANNRTLASKGYDISEELSKAVDLVARAKTAMPDVYKEGMPVSPFGRMQGLFDDEFGDSRVTDGTALLLADILNSGKPSDLRKVLSSYNNEAAQAAGGQIDMFLNSIPTKEEILTNVNEHFRNATPKEQQALVGAAIAERKRRAEAEAEQRERSEASEQTPHDDERRAEPQQPVAGDTELEPLGKDRNDFYEDTPEEAALRARISVGDEWEEEGPAPDKPIYKRKLYVDGKHEVIQTDAPDKNGSYTGSRLTFDGRDYGDLKEIVDHIDGKTTCPVCGKTHIPNYKEQDVVCPQCNSDLSVFRQIDQLSDEEAVEVLANIERMQAEPTEAQKAAGNYKMEHRRVDGYNISIENPKGSVRRGTSKDNDGNETPWETTMQNDYGYIRGTEGVDGDHIDVFLSDTPEEGDVFVVDQVNKDGSFDEHKVMYGFHSEQEAREAYLSNYEPGWTGLGAITHVSKEEFKKWIGSSIRKTKPFAEYKSVKVYKEQNPNLAIEPDGFGDFGPVFTQFKGDAQGAIKVLSELQDGEAIGALHHKDIGDIDLVWGNAGTGKSDGFGLAKLVKFHPEVVEHLQEILDDMHIVKRSENRINLESDTHKAAVRLTWNKKKKKWLLTAFEKRETSESIGKTTDTDDNPSDLRGDTALSQNSDVSDRKVNTLSADKQTESAESSRGAIKREKPATAEAQEKDKGKPFEHGDRIAELQQKVDEYSEAMQAELKEKEDKYAAMDAEVEEATDITFTEEDDDVEGEKNSNGDGQKFRLIEDSESELLDFLNAQRLKPGWRYAQWADYGIRPPMTAKVNGEWRPRMQLGRWEQSEEGMMNKAGKADLVQGNGRTTGNVAYNPYFHIRTSPMNDQFSAAWDRPELLPIFGYYPESEETSGYHAEGAKNSVGLMSWHSGTANGQLTEGNKIKTMLSRYFKPERIASWSEVADEISPALLADDVRMPINVVPPMLRAELAKRGVKFGPISGSVSEADVEYLNDILERVNNGEWNAGLERAQAYVDAYESRPEVMGARVDEISQKLHTPMRVLTPEETAKLPTRRERRAKGWYAPKTGEIVINLVNNDNVADVENTALHEAAGHYGLRVLVGEENMPRFLDEVYNHASTAIRNKIDAGYEKRRQSYIRNNGGGAIGEAHFVAEGKEAEFRRDATEEYMSDLGGRIGEKGFEKMEAEELTFWGEVKELVNKFLDKLLRGLNIAKSIKLSDKHLGYILYKSWKNLKNRGPIAEAEDITMRRRSGYDETPEDELKKFRDGDSDMGLEETITKMKADAAQANADNLQKRNDAMRAIGANLNHLRSAMARQREYDLTTVRSVTDLAKILMDANLLDNVSKSEMKALLGIVNQVVGRKDVTPTVQRVMDLMVKNQLRNSESMLSKLLSIRGSKVDAKGVEVQGELDAQGQEIARVMKKTMHLPVREVNANGELEPGCLESLLQDATDRMGDSDPLIAEAAANEVAGLNLAMEYAENVTKSKAEEQLIQSEMKKAEAEKQAGRMTPDAYKQFAEAAKEQIRTKRIELVEAYHDLIGRLAGELGESVTRAAEFKDKRKNNIADIHHNANSDMEGRPLRGQRKDSRLEKLNESPLIRMFLEPLASFDQMLRMFGGKNANGEGYLWNRFMHRWVKSAEREQVKKEQNQDAMDAEAAAVLGKKKCWNDLYDLNNALPKLTVSFWDGGEMREHEMSQLDLLTLLLWDAQPMGRATLRKMNVDDAKMAEIEAFIDPRLREIGRWMVDYLSNKRLEFNEVHKEMFGASMAANENYFPFRRAGDEIKREVENGTDPDNDRPSTTTGSIIKRRFSVTPFDIVNCNAADLFVQHLNDMEHWAAFGPLNRDLGILLSYKRFKQQVKNMRTIYGSGSRLWKLFSDCCAIATESYQPKTGRFDKALVRATKGVAMGKVNLRPYTALKQTLSLPAFLPDCDVMALGIGISTAGIVPLRWCWENMPLFRKRILSRTAGDYRLKASQYDTKIMKFFQKGMLPNIGVDAWTIAVGCYSVFKAREKRYIRQGMSKEQAKAKAIRDAEISFNESQQSSEGPFLAPIQVDHSAESFAVSLFRNSAYSYTRKAHEATRNLRNLTTGKSTVEFMKKQLVREGMEDSAAEKEAKRLHRKAYIKNTVQLAVFGWMLPWLWRLGGLAPLLLLSSDDDQKDKAWNGAIRQSMFGPIEGTTAGDVTTTGLNMAFGNEDVNWEYVSKQSPIFSDIAAIQRTLDKDAVAATNDVLNIIVGMGTGLNPQTLTDMVTAIVDACDADPETSREAALLWVRLLNVPQSQIDQIYFEEIDMNGREASKLSPEALAERYAEYKTMRNAPLTQWIYNEDERDEVLNRHRKHAEKELKEVVHRRVLGETGANAEDLAAWEDEYKATEKRLKRINDLKEHDKDKARKQRHELIGAPEYHRYLILKRYHYDVNELTKQFLSAKTAEERDTCARRMKDLHAKAIERLERSTEYVQQ